MTKKDLFRIIIKIAGLYFLVTVIFNATPAMTMFFSRTPWWSIVSFFVVLLMFSAIFVALVFKPDIVIKALNLDKGFDDDAVRLKPVGFSDLLKIAIIAIGLSLIVKHLPLFITQIVLWFRLLVKNQIDMSSQMHADISNDFISWGVKMISLIIGYLMIANYNKLSDFIIKKTQQPEAEAESEYEDSNKTQK